MPYTFTLYDIRKNHTHWPHPSCNHVFDSFTSEENHNTPDDVLVTLCDGVYKYIFVHCNMLLLQTVLPASITSFTYFLSH